MRKKSNIFKIFKNQHTCCRTIPRHLVCQISGFYIYFWQTYNTKTVSVDTVLDTAIFSIYIYRTEIKMTIVES